MNNELVINEDIIKRIVEGVLKDSQQEDKAGSAGRPSGCAVKETVSQADTSKLPDITTINLRQDFHVSDSVNKEAYLKLKKSTPARLAIGRSGPRYRTQTMLRLRADHAAAKDAVWTSVSQDFIDDLGLTTIQTKASDKDEFLRRPDLGRILDEENSQLLRKTCKKDPTVQIIVVDGLSSKAIEANIKDVLPSLEQGLRGYNIDIGTTFFVKNGRVGIADYVSDQLNAEVTIVFIGERPGLVSAESMSCYMTYKAHQGISESKRTVISNIYDQGTPAVEAGAHIAEVVKKMLEAKASGVDLKL